MRKRIVILRQFYHLILNEVKNCRVQRSFRALLLRMMCRGAGSRFLPPAVCLLLSAYLFAGCGTNWQQKFIRRKPKEARPAKFEVKTVVPQRLYPELYKEHFIYWRNWHRQLLEDLEGNSKRRREDMRETRRHLVILEKYLMEAQARKVRPLVEQLDQLLEPVKSGRLSSSDYGILRRRLEALQLEIERTLHYQKMKKFLLPTPVLLDMTAYEGEEPTITPSAIKSPGKPADEDRDEHKEPATLTYEEYRARPLS